MNVNRESGKAFTLYTIIKSFAGLAVVFTACVLLYAALAAIPEAEINWHAEEYDDGSFAIYPSIYQKQHYIGNIPVWCFDFVYDRYNDAREAYDYCFKAENELIAENLPSALEAQYIVDGSSAMIKVQGFYTQDGERVEIYREFPLHVKYFKKSDYGPATYTEKLIYIPEEIRQERLLEIEKNRAEIEDLKENGTSLRKHRVFYTVLFSVISLAAIFGLLRYYKKYNPKFRMTVLSSSRYPGEDFYYIIPAPEIDTKLFGKIEVTPAEHLLREYSDAERACNELRKICESHREDIPARFEATYIPAVSGGVLELRGYYTEGGLRRDMTERITLETGIFKDAFFPPAELKPDLSWHVGDRG